MDGALPQMAVDHYENFPVASLLLPSRFRDPVALIYRFAREADDFADEGNDATGGPPRSSSLPSGRNCVASGAE